MSVDLDNDVAIARQRHLLRILSEGRVAATPGKPTPPLHAACQRSDVDAVVRLLEAGADTTEGDANGRLAIELAAATPASDAIVRALLKANSPAPRAMRLVDRAACERIREVVLDAIAVRSHRLPEAIHAVNGPDVIRLLLLGADPDHRLEDGTPMTQLASMSGSEALLHVLVHAGAQVPDASWGQALAAEA